MASNQPLCLLAPLFALALLVVGCDGFSSGRAPSAPAPEDNATTISFSTENIAITEESGTVEIGVEMANPPENDSVTAEVLYADGVSTTSPSDFNLSGGAVAGEGYVAGTVGFSSDDTSGTTKTLELNIQDEEENEPKEDGIFVLQNVEGATVGDADRLTVAIGALEILFKDFASSEIPPMFVRNVTNGNGWSIGSSSEAGNSPFVSANAFGGSEASNSWLITPALNFNEFEGETLTFINAKNFDDGGLEQERALQVKVSTDYDGSGNPENFEWENISDRVETFSTGGYTYQSSGEIDLTDSQFQSDEVYVAFHYISSGTGGSTSEEWQVDNIRIVGR